MCVCVRVCVCVCVCDIHVKVNMKIPTKAFENGLKIFHNYIKKFSNTFVHVIAWSLTFCTSPQQEAFTLYASSHPGLLFVRLFIAQ